MSHITADDGLLKTSRTKREDRVLGVLFGQAIGDALGLGTEFMSKSEVQKRYPGGLRSYGQLAHVAERRGWQAGEWTDDTDMMLCIARAILKNAESPEKCSLSELAASEFLKWLHGNPRGIGEHTFKVLSAQDYARNPTAAAERVWKESSCNSAANGALMRTSVVGIFDTQTAEKAEMFCKLTHYDPRCVGSCVIVSEIINALINGRELCLDEIAAIANRYDPRIEEYVRIALSPEISGLKLDAEPGIGYTLRTLSAGLWVYFNSKTFEDGLLAVVNEGGDADTNAACAGAVLGAKFGFKAIPDAYTDGLLRSEYLYCLAKELAHIS